MTIKRLAFAFSAALFLLTLCVRAQTPQLNSVNLAAEEGRVRASVQGEVYDLKMEVLDESGETVFEGAPVGGRELDWKMTNQRGERVQPGTYTVLVSYTTPSGKPRKRIEQVLVTEEVKGGAAGQKVVAPEAESSASVGETAAAPNPQPLVDGGGAANRIPKFTDADTVTNSSMIDLGGKVGLGTTAPAVPGLHIGSGVPEGQARLKMDNSNGQYGGLNRWSNRFELMSSDAVGISVGGVSRPHMWVNASGNVGIGTFAPAAPGLHIGPSVAGGQARIKLDNSNGQFGWLSRWTNRLELMSSDAIGFAVGGVASPNFWIAKDGKVGIGTLAPLTKLQVESFGMSELTVRSPDGRAILSLDGRAGGQRRVWTLESGPFGEANVFGIFDRTAGRLRLKIDAGGRTLLDGHVAQPLTANGLVKYMATIDPSKAAGSQITRCYNSQRADGGASVPQCGFSANGFALGRWTIDFGNTVTGRFAIVSINSEGGDSAVVPAVFNKTNNFEVSLRYSNQGSGSGTNATFTIIVF